MKVCFFTLGTRGDVQPYVALGRELIREGHKAVICVGESFRQLVASNGIDFVPTTSDLMAIAVTPEGKAILEHPIKNLKLALNYSKQVINPAYRKTLEASYFNAVYKEAVELCVYLCKQYGLTEKDIICHSEGHKLGVASNHGDVMHLFPKHGKSMDAFRDEVKALLNTTASPDPAPNKEPLIHAGDIVKIIGSKYYGGKVIPDWVKKLTWYVHSIKGNRAVLNEDKNHEYAIMSPVKATDLVLVTKAIPDSYTVHSVVEGDTLWSISNKYLGAGSRYQEIMTLNGLTSTVINIGQKLKMPK